MQEIFRKVLACDLLVFATPIYSWYCTPPLKAAMDRLAYGMDKYYGDEKRPAPSHLLMRSLRNLPRKSLRKSLRKWMPRWPKAKPQMHQLCLVYSI